MLKLEAVTVRLIYRLFLEGKTPLGIENHLTANGIPTPGGKNKWQASTMKVFSAMKNIREMPFYRNLHGGFSH